MRLFVLCLILVVLMFATDSLDRIADSFEALVKIQSK